MRMLLFRGNFSWDGEHTHHGLICFCHFHIEDDSHTIQSAKEKIERRLKSAELYDMDKDEKAILIPFSCLDIRDTTMLFPAAQTLFEKLSKSMPEAVAMPFASSNEMHLTVHNSDPYVKFIQI